MSLEESVYKLAMTLCQSCDAQLKRGGDVDPKQLDSLVKMASLLQSSGVAFGSDEMQSEPSKGKVNRATLTGVMRTLKARSEP